MICYSFITVQDAQKSKNRTLNKNDVFTLLDYLDGYDLGDTRDMEVDVIIRKLDAIQKVNIYIHLCFGHTSHNSFFKTNYVSLS